MSMQATSCVHCYGPLDDGQCRRCVVSTTQHYPLVFAQTSAAGLVAPSAPAADGNTMTEQERMLREFQEKREQEKKDAELAKQLAESVDAAPAPARASGVMPGIGRYTTEPVDEAADLMLALRIQEEEEAEERRARLEAQERRDREYAARIAEEKERVRRDRELAERIRMEEVREEADRRERERIAAAERERIAAAERERLRLEGLRLAREAQERRDLELARYLQEELEGRGDATGMDGTAMEISYEHGVPSTWLRTPDGSSREGIYRVGKRTEEFQAVLSRVRESLPSAFIVKLERIQRPRLWRWFVMRQEEVARENAGDCNEMRLFHGSRAGAQLSIAQEGFDQRLANASGMLGAGVYFSDRASVSWGYASGKQLLLCRVTIGAVTRGSTGLKRPPAMEAGHASGRTARYYHSTTDFRNHFAVFENSLAYPEYLITLR